MPGKPELRRVALARRAAEPDRPAKSDRIAARVLSLPRFRTARVVSSYIGVGDEVATDTLVHAALEAGQRLAVPWRDGDRLRLASIQSPAELNPASFGLLEPGAAIRGDPGREVPLGTVDVLLVPGVAFDRRGGRLGHGRGYYDRLLGGCRADALRVGLGFECQLFDEIPMGQTDQRLDLVVTEQAVYLSERTVSADP